MAEQIEVARDPSGEAIDKACMMRRLGPQIDMKEIRLVIGPLGEAERMANELEDDQPLRPSTIAPGGMPWHRVRMFWRWRVGKLELVRPHFRGSAENGVSRRVTLLLHPDEVRRRRSQPGKG